MTGFLAGLLLGVAGSAHCVGMCGPLALAVGRSLSRRSRGAELRASLIYHAGRVLTYLALALPAGLAGGALSDGGFGRALAVVSGGALLLFSAGSLRPRLPGRASRVAATAAARLCGRVSRWSVQHPVAGPLATGSANGLLPCGLVYAALTAATAMGGPAQSVALMLGFGLGTVPALVVFSCGAIALAPLFRTRLRRLTPVVLALVATLLILRGLTPHAHPAGHGAHHRQSAGSSRAHH